MDFSKQLLFFECCTRNQLVRLRIDVSCWKLKKSLGLTFPVKCSVRAVTRQKRKKRVIKPRYFQFALLATSFFAIFKKKFEYYNKTKKGEFHPL